MSKALALRKINKLAAGVLLGLGLLSQAALAQEAFVALSKEDYNRIHFPAKVVGLIAKEASFFEEKPQPLANGRVLLVNAAPEAGDTELIVQLQGGGFVSMRLLASDIPGVSFTVRPDMVEGLSAAAHSKAPLPSPVNLVPTFKAFVSGTPPADFYEIDAPIPVRFDEFDARPVKAWGNGSERMVAFQLHSRDGVTVRISPSQFYREGVKGVLLSSEAVSPDEVPMLYLLTTEALWDESNG